ncbi:hypothetical protein K469DRAFT_696453 [Zopfia rhizophila CBS 207.26]|uniref:Uncharacterized protein n=1 Tax=Zopfia rhizophila CBS 207.26 TaxID=1314779 RepID=A0A6A6DDX4_9PEZI|nr:hypothetical protein K469DRAFT_696453 [Zopfia rhizophila CBS 207.26]
MPRTSQPVPFIVGGRSNPANSNQPSILLLHAELRLEIHHYLLREPKPIDVPSSAITMVYPHPRMKPLDQYEKMPVPSGSEYLRSPASCMAMRCQNNVVQREINLAPLLYYIWSYNILETIKFAFNTPGLERSGQKNHLVTADSTHARYCSDVPSNLLSTLRKEKDLVWKFRRFLCHVIVKNNGSTGVIEWASTWTGKDMPQEFVTHGSGQPVEMKSTNVVNFLDLPRRIRQGIYEFTLCTASGCNAFEPHMSAGLVTCAFRDLALYVFTPGLSLFVLRIQSTHELLFVNFKSLWNWMLRIGPKQRGSLRLVRLLLDFDIERAKLS